MCLCGALIGSSVLFGGCAPDEVQVYAPDGAPALALAKLLSEDGADDGIEYTITSADKIISFVDGKEPQADVCILPVNQASNLLGDGDTYQMVGLATHGNMYFVSADNTPYTIENIAGLKGKKIGVVQLANVPGLAFRIALDNLGISYDMQTQSADAAYLYGVTPDEVSPLGEADVYLVPEPAASAKIKAFTAQGKPFYMVGDLQAMYGASGFPQAAVVAKKSFIKEEKEKLEEIMAGLSQAEGYLQTASVAEICASVSSHLEEGLKGTFSTKNLTTEVISRCNVRFEKSVDCRLRVDEFLQKMQSVAADSASTVADEFYYIEG